MSGTFACKVNVDVIVISLCAFTLSTRYRVKTITAIKPLLTRGEKGNNTHARSRKKREPRIDLLNTFNYYLVQVQKHYRAVKYKLIKYSTHEVCKMMNITIHGNSEEIKIKACTPANRIKFLRKMYAAILQHQFE